MKRRDRRGYMSAAEVEALLRDRGDLRRLHQELTGEGYRLCRTVRPALRLGSDMVVRLRWRRYDGGLRADMAASLVLRLELSA